MAVVERDYPNLYRKFTSLGPLLDKLGNGGKGLSWDTREEVEFLGQLNHRSTQGGVGEGRPCIESAIDAAEVILHLAPETNGHVAVKAWKSLGEFTGRDHTHLAAGKEHEAIRFRDVQAQPRKDYLLPDLVGDRERGGLLQRRLHQRARADPMADAHRQAAVLPGPPLDDGLRRAVLQLPPARRPEDNRRDRRDQAQRQPGDPAELH